jgi:hypothetical protein
MRAVAHHGLAPRPETGHSLLLAGYLVTAYLSMLPRNRTDADDAFIYAAAVRDLPLDGLMDGRYVFFMPLARLLATLLPGADVHALMVGTSVAAAAAFLVLFHRLLVEEFGLSPSTAAATTVFAGTAHGFWRYAVEAEVYAVSLLLVAAGLRLGARASRPGAPRAAVAAAALAAAAAVLYYKPNVVHAAFTAFGIFAVRRRFARGAACAAGAAAVVVLGYAGAAAAKFHRLDWAHFAAFAFKGVPTEPRVSASSALLAAGTNVWSATYLMGIRPLAEFVERRFPTKDIGEEILAAASLGPLALLPAALLVALAALSAALVAQALLGPAGPLRAEWRPRWGGGGALRWMVAAWLATYAAIIFRLDPASQEPWIMALPLLAILLGTTLFRAAEAAGRAGLVHAFVLIGAAHNSLGGMLPLMSREHDGFLRRSAETLAAAGPGDGIVTCGKSPFSGWLRYHARAPVHSVREAAASAALVEGWIAAGRRVYLLGDCLAPEETTAHEAPARYREIVAFRAALLGRVEGECRPPAPCRVLPPEPSARPDRPGDETP